MAQRAGCGSSSSSARKRSIAQRNGQREIASGIRMRVKRNNPTLVATHAEHKPVRRRSLVRAPRREARRTSTAARGAQWESAPPNRAPEYQERHRDHPVFKGDFPVAMPSRRAVTQSPDCSMLRAICACTESTRHQDADSRCTPRNQGRTSRRLSIAPISGNSQDRVSHIIAYRGGLGDGGALLLGFRDQLGDLRVRADRFQTLQFPKYTEPLASSTASSRRRFRAGDRRTLGASAHTREHRPEASRQRGAKSRILRFRMKVISALASRPRPLAG